jgi:hypothetical protein
MYPSSYRIKDKNESSKIFSQTRGEQERRGKSSLT